MSSSWLWWPMTGMWPSVTLCTTWSSWNPGSVVFWFCHLTLWDFPVFLVQRNTFHFLYFLLQSLMVVQLSFCTNNEIPHFFCETSQLSYLPFLTPPSVTWWCILQECWLVVFPSRVFFTLTLRQSPLYVESHQLRGSIKHFPPVHLTSQLSPYFTVQS